MSIYVDIAIAIILVFFSLSLVVTAMNEVVAAALNLRGRLLWRAVVTLIDDAALREQVLASAPLRAILLMRSGRDQPTARRFPDRLPSFEIARALLSAAPSPGPKTMIGALMEEARAEAGDTVNALARRYDSAMAQLSIRYKRRQQVYSAAFGVALAAVLNVNVIAMAAAMGADEALRAAIVGHAEAFVTRVPADPDRAAGSVEAVRTTLGTFAKDLGELRTMSSLAGFGWTPETSDAFLRSPVQMILTVLAWIVAGLSTVLGAPFWFDLLNRGVRLRSAAPEAVRPTTQQDA